VEVKNAVLIVFIVDVNELSVAPTPSGKPNDAGTNGEGGLATNE
jgi:hypothetical protein